MADKASKIQSSGSQGTQHKIQNQEWKWEGDKDLEGEIKNLFTCVHNEMKKHAQTMDPAVRMEIAEDLKNVSNWLREYDESKDGKTLDKAFHAVVSAQANL